VVLGGVLGWVGGVLFGGGGGGWLWGGGCGGPKLAGDTIVLLGREIDEIPRKLRASCPTFSFSTLFFRSGGVRRKKKSSLRGDLFFLLPFLSFPPSGFEELSFFLSGDGVSSSARRRLKNFSDAGASLPCQKKSSEIPFFEENFRRA